MTALRNLTQAELDVLARLDITPEDLTGEHTMTDEKTRALIAALRANVNEAARGTPPTMAAKILAGESDDDRLALMVQAADALDAFSALTVPDGDVRERLIESIAGGTISIPGGYGELARDDAENIVDTILSDPALSRAAAPEPLHESPAIQAARDVLDGLEDWEIQDHALEEIRSALDDIPCCESATAMVHAEDHGAPAPEWEYGVQAAVNIDGSPNARIDLALEKELPHLRESQRRGWCTLYHRRKAGPWEPLPVGGDDAAL